VKTLSSKTKGVKSLRDFLGRSCTGAEFWRQLGFIALKGKPTCDSLTHSLGLYGP